jgi:hypothetical protein
MDGARVADGEEYGRRWRTAERGRHSEGRESKSPSPPSGTKNGCGSGAGCSLHSRNGPAAVGRAVALKEED